MAAHEPDRGGDAPAPPVSALPLGHAGSSSPGLGPALRTLLRRAGPLSWTVWSYPAPVLVLVLAIDALATAVVVSALGAAGFRRSDLLALAILVAGSAVHLEAVRHVERLRESVSGIAPYIDAKSTWSFAAVVLLPLGPALAVAAFTFAYWWLRVSQRPPPHRWLFTFATVVLGSAAAHAILSVEPTGSIGTLTAGPLGLLLLASAVVARWTINFGLVVVVITLTSPDVPWRRRLGSPTEYLVGIGALVLGVALACLVHLAPWLVPLLLVPAIALHRGVLLPQFVRAAQRDPKTGLPNVTHWRDRSAREITRLERRGHGHLGVLMLDLDGFKLVNDRHGHLAGDRVLRAVADVLQTEVRPFDIAGRFGGEEFVVLLADIHPDETAAVGERLRRRIAELEVAVAGGSLRNLSASVGAAAYPLHGRDVDDLVAAADTALYAAKRAGRNRVELASG